MIERILSFFKSFFSSSDYTFELDDEKSYEIYNETPQKQIPYDYVPSYEECIDYYIEPNLPYNYVHTGKYFNGVDSAVFYAFSEKEDSNIYFCSCQKQAIKNMLDICDKFSGCTPHVSGYKLYNHIIKMKFPSVINMIIHESNCQNGKDIFQLLQFKDNLCHLCNHITPTEDFTKYEYASKFEKKYGQYLRVALHNIGIGDCIDSHNGIYFIEDALPEDFKKLLLPTSDEIISDIQTFYKLSEDELERVKETMHFINSIPQPERTVIMYNQYEYPFPNKEDYGYLLELEKEYPIDNTIRTYITKVLWKRYLEIKRIATSEIKAAFKVKRWVNESILINYVKEMFKDKTIYTHYRPPFLDGLELDVYIKELNVGIEYQGIQHEKPIDAWGGEEALQKRKEYDRKKIDLCKKNNVDLFFFWYYEDLNKELIKSKLAKYIKL